MPTNPASKFAVIDQRLANRPAPVTCKACLLISEPERFGCTTVDARFLDGMIQDRAVGAGYIARVLAEGGVAVGESSIKRHRTKHL